MRFLFFALTLATSFLSAQDKKGSQNFKSDVSVLKETVPKPDNQQKNKQLSDISLYGSTVSAKVNISTGSSRPVEKEIKKDDEEYYEVMTDAMETQTYSSYQLQNDQQDKEVTDPIPLSYGNIKAAINEMGKNYLIFENEDGEIYILNIYTDKNGLFSWKLHGKFQRN